MAPRVIIGGRFSTIASEIYLQLVGYSDLEKSSAMNMFLLLPAIAAFFLYRYLMLPLRQALRGEPGPAGAAGAVPLTVRLGGSGHRRGEHPLFPHDGAPVRLHLPGGVPQEHQGGLLLYPAQLGGALGASTPLPWSEA